MTGMVDARGLACPQPVILTRRALAESADLLVVVTSEASRNNVRRIAEKLGRKVMVGKRGEEFYLRIVDESVSVGKSDSQQLG